MDEFDFSAPVHAVILFDESDDETFEAKPFIDDIKVKEETTNYSSKVEQVQKEIAKETKNCLLTPLSNTTKTEKECTIRKLSNYVESTLFPLVETITENNYIKKHDTSKQKSLDMPSIEGEENNNIGNCNSFMKEREQHKETKANDNTNLEKQINKETATENRKVFKRRPTEELNNSDKRRKANENKKICKLQLNPTNETNEMGIHKDINLSTDKVNRVQDSSQLAVYSKYFGNCIQAPFSKEISSIELQEHNIEREKTYTSDIEMNPKTQRSQKQTNEDRSFHSLNDTSDTITVYFKRLLDAISENMIYILNSHHNYVKLYKSNANPRLIENAKNGFIGTRNHFFDLSYSSVVNIIVPRNNDPTFVKNFLTNTIEIGHSKCYNYSYEQTQLLYSDMITWAQRKKVQLQNMDINKISNPILLQELVKPRSEPPVNQQVQEWSQVSRRNSTQSRLPRHINESLNSHIPNQHRQPYPITVQQLQDPVSRKPPPPYLNQNHQYLEKNSSPNVYRLPSSRFTDQNNIELTHSHQINAPRQPYVSQMPNTYPNQKTWPRSNYIQQQMQTSNTQPYPNLNNKVQRATLLQDSVPPWHKSANSMRQEEAPRTWLNDPKTSYVQAFQQHLQERISSQNNNQQLQPDNIVQIETNRSSISRDSGFMSPLNFNISHDVSLQEEQVLQQPTTPLITHVTSLNPNASLIEDGNCAVCGKVTKQKCIGCYSCYYCSHNCQFLAWETHQLICK